MFFKVGVFPLIRNRFNSNAAAYNKTEFECVTKGIVQDKKKINFRFFLN